MRKRNPLDTFTPLGWFVIAVYIVMIGLVFAQFAAIFWVLTHLDQTAAFVGHLFGVAQRAAR